MSGLRSPNFTTGGGCKGDRHRSSRVRGPATAGNGILRATAVGSMNETRDALCVYPRGTAPRAVAKEGVAVHRAKPSLMSRRKMLRTTSMLLAGGALGLGGCVMRSVAVPGGRQSRRLVPVRVSEDLRIRQVVGLRPFRPSGFVVRAEPFGDKLLVHNYGHGGAGVTLSWGTSHLAVEEVLASGRAGPAAVLGCGVIGLSTARLLQRHGFPVTIYARDLPPETTSNVPGASWYPGLVVDADRRTPAWDAQFERAARISHRAFQELVGSDYGVRWLPQYYLSGEPIGDGPWEYVMLQDLFPGRILTPDEHPFPAPYAAVDHLMFIAPPVYLRALLRDFRRAGGRIVVREFVEVRQVADLPEPVVANCTGLGARDLFGDRELTAVKGQLEVLLPQPGVQYAVGMHDLYMFPRADGIILGGTRERGVESLEPNPEATRRIFEGHRRIFQEMDSAR